MRPNAVRDIKRILRGCEHGKLDPIKLGYLLVKLRYVAPRNDPFWDIASYVAHDNRELGLSYKSANDYFDRVLELMKSPASVANVSSLSRGQLFITQQDFIQVMEKRLHTIGVDVDISKFGFQIMCNVLDNLEGSEFVLKDDSKKEIARLKLSEVITDEEDRKTLYMKVVALSPPFDREAASRRDWQPLVMGTGTAVGFPLLQAVPADVEPYVDAYIWTNTV